MNELESFATGPHWGTYADWAVAFATILLAIVAVWQERIRAWWDSPRFEVTAETTPPCCNKVELSNAKDGHFVAECIYLRINVKNVGRSTARNVEVYAESLELIRAELKLERVQSFPPMHLTWSNTPRHIIINRLGAAMSRYCDVGRIVDPQLRNNVSGDNSPRLGLDSNTVSLCFSLQTSPNHKAHIVGPGNYVLTVLVAAENRKPNKHKIKLFVHGTWHSDEAIMLRDFISIRVVAV